MTSPLDDLLDAIRREDDTAAEAAVTRLQPEDELALLALADDGSDDARWWMVRSLAQCGSTAALPTLISALSDGDAAMRATAALALANIYQRDTAVAGALPAVAGLLCDDEGVVRQAGTDALAMCGDAAVPVLAGVVGGEHEGARSRAMAALRKIATIPAAKVMFQYLNDENYLVRTYAYEGLDEMGLLENVLLRP